MREQLIAAGVRELKKFGYPGCTAENILTDRVYRAFFRRMLEGTAAEAGVNSEAAGVCRRLMAEIDAAR